MLINRGQGFLIIGSGMIVHSFFQRPAIDAAPTSEAREELHAKYLAESKRFDSAVKRAASVEDVGERKAALLALEKTEEFAHSHPTVEVRSFLL
jgi:aromatic ring-opening dioxygenase catalytic subunit (LigB family)